MKPPSYVKTRVPESTKTLIRTAAMQAYLTEAAWFRRTIDRALRTERGISDEAHIVAFSDRRSAKADSTRVTRIYLRLRGDDRIILRERAAARGMPVATYASVLLRAHMRHLNPLPRSELQALNAAVVELGAIGRNLNQIARVVNMSRTPSSPARADLEALLRVCEALRAHVKDLLKANLHSWAVGHADDEG